MMASRDIKDLCPEMRIKVIQLLSATKSEGIDVLVYCTFRPEEEQLELYGHGRNGDKRPIVTWTKKGKHNVRDANGKPAAEALDLVPVVMGKAKWDDRQAYLRIAEIARKLGLRWGGDWDRDGKPFEKGESDLPHFELIR